MAQSQHCPKFDQLVHILPVYFIVLFGRARASKFGHCRVTHRIGPGGPLYISSTRLWWTGGHSSCPGHPQGTSGRLALQEKGHLLRHLSAWHPVVVVLGFYAWNRGGFQLLGSDEAQGGWTVHYGRMSEDAVCKSRIAASSDFHDMCCSLGLS